MELIIIIVGILIDRLSKLWAIKTLKDQVDIVLIKNFFRMSYLENKGAAFGIFQGKTIFLTIFTSIIIIAILVFLFKYKMKNRLFSISLGLIISGAIGNLIDRIYYKYVVDFILVHFKDVYYFPTFNMADVLVVIGTCLLAIYILKDVK